MARIHSPSLSIVIPVYDEVECLPTLVAELATVLDQLSGEAEIVVVDDGSTDGSFERLCRARRPRAAAARRAPARNYGQTAALAAGIEAARGDDDRLPRRRSAERPARHSAPPRRAATGGRRRARLAARAPGPLADAPPAVADRQPAHLRRHRHAAPRLRLHAAGHARRRWPRSCGSTASCTASSRRWPPISGARVVELPVSPPAAHARAIEVRDRRAPSA